MDRVETVADILQAPIALLAESVVARENTSELIVDLDKLDVPDVERAVEMRELRACFTELHGARVERRPQLHAVLPLHGQILGHVFDDAVQFSNPGGLPRDLLTGRLRVAPRALRLAFGGVERRLLLR